MKWLDKLADDMATTPSASVVARLVLVLLTGVGLTMTGFGSLFLKVGPIPFKFIPDLRPVLLMSAAILPGLWASFGGAGHRKALLWSVIGIVLAFHLEEATVHWVAPVPGSITGTRVGLLGTAGSLLAVACALLLHLEVEHVRLARDLQARGADAVGAWTAARQLKAEGTRRIVGLSAVAAAVGLFVFAIEKVIGDDATGGTYVLFFAGGILLVAAFLLLRVARPKPAAPEAAAPQE